MNYVLISLSCLMNALNILAAEPGNRPVPASSSGAPETQIQAGGSIASSSQSQLPPKGADNQRLTKFTSRASSSSSSQVMASIQSTSVTYVPDKKFPLVVPGKIQMEIKLSIKPVDHYVDVYVGGYLSLIGNYGKEGKYGQTSAYHVLRIQPEAFDDTNTARIFARVPDVQPAQIRFEVYRLRPEGDQLVENTESTFDTSWPDYRILTGSVFGDIKANRLTKIALLFSHPEMKFSFKIPRPPGKGSTPAFGLGHKLTKKEKDEFIYKRERPLPTQAEWAGTVIELFPSTSILDRDRRNNKLWPLQPNQGFVNGPPVPLN